MNDLTGGREAVQGADGKYRCIWPGSDPLYLAYHDSEWGVPEYDSRTLWEKLMLDGFQAGLSWITILRRRAGFRAAFLGFEPAAVAALGPDDVEHCQHRGARGRNHRSPRPASLP